MAGYKTNLGQCICGDSLDLLAGLTDGSVDLVITSPPFALQRKKAYGNEEQNEYVDWLAQFGKLVYKKLKPEGSFVLDIGAAYEKGQPTYSLYQFRVLLKLCDDIGFHLAQPFYWHNPSALPAPIEWVNKRKMRAKNSVNTVWWLSKQPQCKADITKVLTPYSDRMQKLFKNPDGFVKEEGIDRPSGHVMGRASWMHNNGGAIPPNLLQISNSESNSQYLRICKALGLKGHPARFPAALPSFFIKLLTDEGDLVVDIFGGSNTTGKAAEDLNRRWLTFELLPDYVAASVFRFVSDKDQAEQLYQTVIQGNDVTI
jgi:site-specific DNA-methyltransferase (cytosine-N4-specific)